MKAENKAKAVETTVLSRIYGNGRGWAFFANDFADLGSREAVHLALHRLEKKETIRRVIRGLYEYPRYSDLLAQCMAPDMDEVARALARRFGWSIQATGPAALNLIGLSSQVPGRYAYRSDGPRRTYKVGKTSLEFKPGALKDAGFRVAESGTLVEALKSLGEARINAETLAKCRSWLPATKHAAVLKDTQRVTGWVYDAIKEICVGAGNG